MMEMKTAYRNETFDKIVTALERTKCRGSDGQMYAIHAYCETIANGFSAFTVSVLPWPPHLPDFLQAIEDAGIEEMILLEDSTALMDGLLLFAARGWEVIGPYGKRSRRRWNMTGLLLRRA